MVGGAADDGGKRQAPENFDFTVFVKVLKTVLGDLYVDEEGMEYVQVALAAGWSSVPPPPLLAGESGVYAPW